MATLHFEPDFRFDMDDHFIYTHPLACPSAGTSFSSASSACEPFTPTSRRSASHELSLDFDASFAAAPHPNPHNPHQQHQQHHPDELATPPSTLSRIMFGNAATNGKTEPDLGYTPVLPSTPVRKMDDPMVTAAAAAPGNYESLLGLDLSAAAQQHQQHQHQQHQHQHHSLSTNGPLTPTNSFGMYAISPQAAMAAGGTCPFIMTPTHSLSGSEMADSASSSWSCGNDSPLALFPPPPPPPPPPPQHHHQQQQQHKMMLDGLGPIDLERHSPSPIGRFYLQGAPPASPSQLRAHRKMMVHEIQRKTSELQRAQHQQQALMFRRPSMGTRKLSSSASSVASSSLDKDGAGGVDVVRRAMCKCDYPGCHKAFRRNEHLKRHKQTFHGEGPNRFSCEFCGKDQFNRQDNLNNHRKLHARPNSRNRGVEFIPAAVAIIEQEERSRKRRAPPKSKMAKHEEY